MITNPEIEQYLYGLLPPRDEVLAEMEAQAAERKIPIVGPAVGSLLAVLVRTSGAKRIFELGSAIGYSTIWLARAAGTGAEVHYSDADPRNAAEARAYFERAGLSSKIHIHVGDAIGSLASVSGDFDVVFNDIDKEQYPEVLAVAPGRLRSGGLLITDNSLWHERVLEPADATSRAVCDFNRNTFKHIDLFSVIVPLRDGLTLSVKR
jgi:predicted O-methyltransferase YrrM